VTVLAEGVDSIDQARWLAAAGCSMAQGFLFAQPLGPEALENFLLHQSLRIDWLTSEPELKSGAA
jgi:EAL domain-containing protein (putative c-di-GMP-specific phosphodiesterase class I)